MEIQLKQNCKKSLKIAKGYSEVVYRRTDNMYNGKKKNPKGQTLSYKILHNKLERNQVPRKSGKFLLHQCHPSCYSCYKAGASQRASSNTDYKLVLIRNDCLKPGGGFLTPWLFVFVDIGGIDDYYCLKFLFLMYMRF